jgi:Permeases of the drug/metabolite transporter (DMT) superfamily
LSPSTRSSGAEERGSAADPRAPFVLTLALIGVSTSGPLVRLSHAPPLSIAAWRLAFSLVIIAIALMLTGEWRQWLTLTRGEVGLAAAAGAMLALHFWSWNTSITLTSVAASVVLVNTQPVVVALLSVYWLREPPNRRQWIGIGVAMLGALIVASPDFASGARDSATHPKAWLGDVFALIGALTAATYFSVGRRLRSKLDLWPYVGLVYAVCLVTLVVLTVATRTAIVPQPPRELTLFAGLALGPMLLGHTGLNWALKHSPAYVVNLTLLGEPIGATLIAALLPGIREVPPPTIFLGGAVVCAGVLLASQRGASSPGESR